MAHGGVDKHHSTKKIEHQKTFLKIFIINRIKLSHVYAILCFGGYLHIFLEGFTAIFEQQK